MFLSVQTCPRAHITRRIPTQWSTAALHEAPSSSVHDTSSPHSSALQQQQHLPMKERKKKWLWLTIDRRSNKVIDSLRWKWVGEVSASAINDRIIIFLFAPSHLSISLIVTHLLHTAYVFHIMITRNATQQRTQQQNSAYFVHYIKHSGRRSKRFAQYQLHSCNLCNPRKTNSCWDFYLFVWFICLLILALLHSFSQLFIYFFLLLLCIFYFLVWRSQCSLGRFICKVHYTRMNWMLVCVCVYSGRAVSQVSQFSQRKCFDKAMGGVRMFRRKREIDRLISNLINSGAFTRPQLF
jgi:hypothetical protein